jgi:hypothetical protein
VSTTGIDFRGTAGYVTDPVNCTYCVGDAYPVTRGGATFGWTTGPGGGQVDRLNTNDARLAGINYTGALAGIFRFDLPSTGQYDINLAMGDAGANSNYGDVQLKDNTTAFYSSGTSLAITTTNTFNDAGGPPPNNWSNTAWPGSNVKVTRTFTSTIFNVVCNYANIAHNIVIAHLLVSTAGAAASLPFHSIIIGQAVNRAGTY